MPRYLHGQRIDSHAPRYLHGQRIDPSAPRELLNERIDQHAPRHLHGQLLEPGDPNPELAAKMEEEARERSQRRFLHGQTLETIEQCRAWLERESFSYPRAAFKTRQEVISRLLGADDFRMKLEAEGLEPEHKPGK